MNSIKKLLSGAAIAALLVSAGVATAKSTWTGTHQGLLIVGIVAQYKEIPTYDVTYLGTISWSSGSSISGAIDIGAVHTKKEIFCVAASSMIVSRSLNSVTVAGVTATLATTNYSGTVSHTGLSFVAMPTQSGSQTITATYSGTLIGGAMDVYSVRNRPGIGTNHVSTAGNSSTATSVTLSTCVISINGIWFGTCGHGSTTATTAPSGTTVGSDTIATYRYNFCYRQPALVGSTPSDIWSWSDSQACRAGSWCFT